ncbi:MAG: pyridoxal phosphate-dependent aminotransferase [bacterium]
MTEISRVVDGLKPSGIRDFFDLVMGMDDVISLGVGEPDFVTPRNIREAAIQSLEDGYTNYTSNQGMPELRETISGYLEDKHGISYDPDSEILITVGVSEAMDLAMRALLNPDDHVLIPTPCYVSYKPTALMAGASVSTLETSMDTGFRLTPEMIEKEITPNTKILTLNYPANPTGTSYERDELEEIAEVCREHDVIVFSDEIYGDLTYERDHVPLPTIPGMKDHTLYLNGFSKAHAMTGFRIGYAAGPEEIISAMTKIHQYTMLCVPTSSQFAATEALKNSESAVKSMRDAYHTRRDFLLGRLHDIGLPCARPEGAFYAFPSIEPTGMEPGEFCRELLESKKVATVPGNAFGPGGEQHIRISYATDRELLETAFDRMEEFIEERSLSQPEQKSSTT